MPEGIELRWVVSSREDYLGFHVLRAADGATFDRVTTEMIRNDEAAYPAEIAWTDGSVEAGAEYTYTIEVVRADGTTERMTETFAARAGLPSRASFRITGRHPVPMSRGTEFAYTIADAGGAKVFIALYDVSGRRVATVVDRHVPAGTHAGALSGEALRGLGSGVYFLRMEGGSFKETKRVVLIR